MQTQAAPMDADDGVKLIFVSVIGADHRAHRPAGQRSGPAGLGDRATGRRCSSCRPSAWAPTPVS